MKINLVYPKIPDCTGYLPKKCIAFDKIDGTNIHFLWENKFTSFGTRRDRYDLTDEGILDFSQNHLGLEECPEIFLNQLSDELNKVLLSKFKDKQVIIFGEFCGQNSFAGQHYKEDKKSITIFDVKINDSFLSPNELVDNFDFLPRIVYSGKFSGQFVEDVRNNLFNINEGVVCKGIHKDCLYMCKIKTNQYMNKLKEQFKDNWANYYE